MGCGKSKHDVVSSNTVLLRKKSSVQRNKDQEIGPQTKDDDNNSNVNVNNNVNVNSGVEAQKDGDDNVVKEVVGGKVDDVDSNIVVNSKTENANMVEETLLEKNNDIVVVEGENNANVGEEKVVEKREEIGGVVVADDGVENKTEKPIVEEEVKEEEKKDKEDDDDALKLNENDQQLNDAHVVAEEKDEVSVKEENVTNEEIINVAASEGEEKDLKAEEEQKEHNLSNEDVKAN